jgi:hypothetical protein
MCDYSIINSDNRKEFNVKGGSKNKDAAVITADLENGENSQFLFKAL